jgi:hypothetical protein
MSLPSQGLHLNPNRTFLRLSQYKEKLKKKIDKKDPRSKGCCIKMKTKMKSEPDKDEHEKQQSKKPTQDGEREKKKTIKGKTKQSK